MLYSCPNHELLREIIIQNFYARLPHNDQTMLDTSCAGSFLLLLVGFDTLTYRKELQLIPYTCGSSIHTHTYKDMVA